MGDLISRSALIENFKKSGIVDSEDDAWVYSFAIAMIESTPIVDAVPVVHGKWDKYRLSKLFKLTCSVCHADVDEKTPFCPWRGAKMDGKKVQE